MLTKNGKQCETSLKKYFCSKKNVSFKFLFISTMSDIKRQKKRRRCVFWVLRPIFRSFLCEVFVTLGARQAGQELSADYPSVH